MLPESNRIEYKRKLTDAFEKEVIAFLNYREGGIIYFGVGSDNKVVGIENVDDVQLKIKDRLKNNISPSCLGLFDIIYEVQNKKDIIRLTIASGTEKPYYLKKKGMSEKGCFMRLGSANEPMPTQIIEELFAKRIRNSIGKIKSPYQNLTFEQLKIYYNESGFNLGAKFADNLELITESGDFNYAAYLLSDKNGNSIKVAKYSGKDRVDLIESNEYGFCSLIKATKQVWDKLELENKTFNKITSKERIDKRLFNPVALREAVVNAIVHNDYFNEIPPKFELFSDRIEITSAGSIPQNLSREEFFDGYSVPRNKEIMRIFRDLEMVEYLGSGIPRILKAYSRKSFVFTENFTRMIFPACEVVTPPVTPGVTPPVTPEVKKLLKVLKKEMSRDNLQKILGLKDDKYFRNSYINKALSDKYIEMTIPEKPNSRLQKYRLTTLGKNFNNQPMEEITDQVTEQVTHQVKQLLIVCKTEMSRAELMKKINLKDRVTFRLEYIAPALKKNLIEMTEPDSPKSPTQKYRLTNLGKQMLNKLI